MENMFKELLTYIYVSALKPLGWKKEGSNFRLYCDDGLCKIINFQKSRWNTSQECEFYINMGLYIEETNEISNRKFREYECQLRKRISYAGGTYRLNCEMDLLAAEQQYVKIIKEEALSFFVNFDTKENFVRMLLSGEAQQYTSMPVMHFHTCRLLCDMGYQKEMLEIAKEKKGELFEKLVSEIQKEIF